MRELIKIALASLLPVGIAFVLLLRYGALDLFYFCVLPSLFISGAAAYISGLACRLACQRHWRLNWYLGLLGLSIAAGLGGGFMWLASSLQSGGWGKLSPDSFFLWICASGIIFGFLPAELVVWHYRRKIGEADHAA
jgi:hypothetical protein